jgi:hypothetical protein
MVHRINRFRIGQTSKALGVTCGLYAFVVITPLSVYALLRDDEKTPARIILSLLLPFLYLFGGFIGTAIACALYNWVARRLGGIEMEIDAYPY